MLTLGLLLAVTAQILTIDDEVQLYLLIAIITLTGIPHGSLDYFVERQSSSVTPQKISVKQFLTRYLLSMLAYGIVWWFFPTFSLIAFIGMTAYHFGEIDWPFRSNTKLDAVLYTIYGFLLTAFILTSHIDSAAPILETIVQKKLSTVFWMRLGSLLFPYTCLLLALNILILSSIHAQLGWNKKLLSQFIIQSILLLVIIYWLPLYLSFGFYFGLWHSFISFNLIRKQIQLPNDYAGWTSLVKKALPFSTVAWIGIFLLIVISSSFQTEWLILPNLLVGIAVLTLPHLQVFTKIKVS